MIQWKTEGTKIYQQLATDMQHAWRICEPLTESPEEDSKNDIKYKTWGETKRK